VQKLSSITIVLLVLLLLYLTQCKKPNPVVETIVTTEVKWDTVSTTSEVFVPRVVERVVIDIDTFSSPIDTMSILRDYYSKNYFRDTIKLDTLGIVIIHDTISENNIYSRIVNSRVSIPTKTTTITNYLNRRELYWGIGISGYKEIENISGSVLYRSKKGNAYSIGIGLDSEFRPIAQGQIYFLIK